MKKLLLVVGLFCMAATGWGYDQIRTVNKSSYTASNETTLRIPTTGPGTEFVGVIVGSTSTGGSLTVYDSSNTVSSVIGTVSLETIQSPMFHVYISSALTYTTTNNVGGVTILYRNW